MSEQVPYGFCHCGCGERTNLAKQSRTDLGHVKGEPLRFVVGHGKRTFAPPGGYVVDEQTGCWNWARGLQSEGYGWTHRQYAHRVFWERANGLIPDGLTIDHLCRNRRCVNPDHLEAVTLTENTRRGNSTLLDADKVRAIRADQRMVREIAADYGIAESTVGNIRRRHSWKDVA